MISALRPGRSPKRVSTLSVLIASIAFHGLVLLGLLLVVRIAPASHRFHGFGFEGGDPFSVTWIPSDGTGPGGQFDTTVSDGDSAVTVELQTPSAVPTTQTRLISTTETDPQTVFNRESTEALQIPEDIPTSHTEPASFPVDPAVAAAETARPGTVESDLKPDDEPSPHGKPGRGGSSADDGGDGGERGGSAPGNGTTFFGIATKAKRIVYVIDASESMRQHQAMERAQRQLKNSLRNLNPTSQFQIVFFNLTNHLMSRPGERPRLLPATSHQLRQAMQFIAGIQPDSGTNRKAAMLMALSLEPDVIYLLTDADDPPLDAKDLRDILRSNKKKTAIHVVEFGLDADLSQDSFLKRLARQNAGRHQYFDLTRDDQ
jgi:hypothetical protein